MKVDINPIKKEETIVKPEKNIHDSIETAIGFTGLISLYGIMAIFVYKMNKLNMERNKGEIKNEEN